MNLLKNSDDNITIDKKTLNEVNEIKCLRLFIYHNLSLKSHVNLLITKVSLSSFPLRILSRVRKIETLLNTYNVILSLHLNYYSVPIWGNRFNK